MGVFPDDATQQVRTMGRGVHADEDPLCPSSGGLVATLCKPSGYHHLLLPVPF